MPLALIAEDEPAIRLLLTEWLSRLGFSVATAAHGAEAVELLSQQDFDLLLTDLRMPVLDGMGLLKILSAMSAPPPAIVITAYGDIQNAVEAMKLGAADFIQKPFNFEQLDATIRTALRDGSRNPRPLSAGGQVDWSPELKDLLIRMHTSAVSESLLEALVTALDARESETGAHSKRVSQMAVIFGRSLGLDDTALNNLRRGALLHDIGKIGLTDRILLKPGPLSEPEWDEMRLHPEIGARIVSKLESLRPTADLILAHHERFDGAGYPRGLKGVEIPFGARLFAIVDSIDAMLCPRPYRASMDLPDVLKEIAARSGTQFDPEVCTHFLALPVDQWWRLYNPSEQP